MPYCLQRGGALKVDVDHHNHNNKHLTEYFCGLMYVVTEDELINEKIGYLTYIINIKLIISVELYMLLQKVNC